MRGPNFWSMTHRKPSITLTILLVSAAEYACGDSDPDPACDATEVALAGDAFYPEGVALDADGALLVGSLTSGEIARAEPCGELTTLVPASGAATVGLLIDGDTLWACESDLSFAAPPAVVGYDLETGAELERHPLPAAGSFCNDLALDADGALLATDSTGAAIYRLDGELELFAADPIFEVGPGEFGLNGIAAIGGDVYATNFAAGQLLRIRGGAVKVIELDRPLAAPDGLEVLDGGDLLVVEGNAGKLSRIAIDGDSGRVSDVAAGFDVPSTAAIDGDFVWVVQSQLDHLLGIDPAPPTTPFTVVRAAL